jgi:hypothetical protein
MNSLGDTIRVKVIPGAAKTVSVGFLDDGTEKIRIKAIPEDNKANRELIRFLEERDGGRWEIIHGHTSRQKVLRKKGE